MRTESACSEGNVIAETELPSLKLDDSLEQLGRSRIDLDVVEVASNRENLRRAAVQRSLEHLQRGDYCGPFLFDCVVERVFVRLSRILGLIDDILQEYG